MTRQERAFAEEMAVSPFDGCKADKGELFCETVVFFGGDIWILGAVYRLLFPSGREVKPG